MYKNYFFLLIAASLACLAGCNRVKDEAGSKTEGTSTQLTDAARVKVETSLGDFIITLQPDKAPETVAQFIENVNNGVYNNSIVHNVIQNYEILIGGVKPTTGIHHLPVQQDIQLYELRALVAVKLVV